ncbi:MAG: hypothetical protein KDK45_15295, partial [Leptospiraceae bacterium]|nr:hypothetical protein [Leptospiraceae bacterium]
FLFIYSISNQIVFGIKVIFNYSIPSFLKRLTGIFRVSGRFFWPVSYLLYFSIFFILYRTKRIRRISLIISFVWFLQVIDSSKIVSHYGKLYSEKKEYTSLFHSKSWKELAKPYQKLRIVLPKKNPENWMNLADYALRNNLSINAGYFARVNSEAMASSQKEILEAIIRGRYHKDSLYIFQEKALLEEAILHLSENDLAGMKDGIFLLAPGLKSKKDALGVKEYEYNDLEYYNLSMNEKVLFNSKGSGQRYRFIGWSDPEHWGVWSNNDFSTLNFHLPEGIGDNVILSLESKAFINHLHPVLRVDVFMNNRFMQTLEYTISDNERIRKIRIPKSFLYVKKKSPNRLRFNYNSPKSPAELGISADGRRLGMGLISLSIEK